MTQSGYEDVTPGRSARGPAAIGQPASGQPAGGQPAPGPGGDSPDAEAVLSQALRAMAGGGRKASPSSSPGGTSLSHGDSVADRTPLTTAQVLLIAAIIGLVIGMAVAFVVLLTG